MPNDKLIPLITKVWEAINKPQPIIVIIGGRGSGKSLRCSRLLIIKRALEAPLKAGCFREFQNSISDSVHSLLVEEIERIGLTGFSNTNNDISSIGGSEFKLIKA